MATMNVSLPAQMKAWVEEQAKGGRYGNARTFARDLIRRDQDRRNSIAELRRLVDEGLASGPAEAFDTEFFLARMRKHEKS